MANDLCFDPAAYAEGSCTLEGSTIRYRAWENIGYCAAPVDAIQTLNLYVPEDYYAGAVHNGYTLQTAPIFVPNTVGGDLPGPADCPSPDRFGRPNAVFRALEHGYVVACIGVRGRTSGHGNHEFFEGSKATAPQKETGHSTGKAPAPAVTARCMRRNWPPSAPLRNGMTSLPPTATAPSTIWKMQMQPTSGCSAGTMRSAPCA